MIKILPEMQNLYELGLALMSFVTVTLYTTRF